jgi:hypothetical protein
VIYQLKNPAFITILIIRYRGIIIQLLCSRQDGRPGEFFQRIWKYKNFTIPLNSEQKNELLMIQVLFYSKAKHKQFVFCSCVMAKLSL